ncbi:MAG TPA: cytochrome P450 [Polyangiaceae bacterium]|jgi:cytochrome P450|nr:cytochrome P450 [Polyangiaceae bacterium]
MQAPGPGALRFVRGVRARGFLDFVGDLWREYGDVFQVRLGSRKLLFAIHPDAVEQVTVTHRNKYDKVGSYAPMRRYLTGDGLVGSTGDLWRRQRKLMAPFFTPKGVLTYAELMIQDSVRLQERWQRLAEDGAEVEIAEEMTAVTASIILKSMFSSPSLESIGRIKDAVETMISFVNLRTNGVFLPLWLPTPMNRKYIAARKLVHETIRELIVRRRELAEAEWPDDLLTRLMRARDEETGQPMSETLVRDESITTFFAGHETTARTMTFTWYALATNPRVTERLNEELDRVLGGRVPRVEDLRQLPYAMHTVMEVLRLHPAVPFYARDAVEPDVVGGFDVTPGTHVLLSPYYSHRHPEFWDEPATFAPERWAQKDERRGRSFHTFGAGPRVCIGNNFSLLESHLLLTILAQRFTPKLRQGYQPKWEMKGVLGLAGGLPMQIVARQAPVRRVQGELRK